MLDLFYYQLILCVELKFIIVGPLVHVLQSHLVPVPLYLERQDSPLISTAILSPLLSNGVLRYDSIHHKSSMLLYLMKSQWHVGCSKALSKRIFEHFTVSPLVWQEGEVLKIPSTFNFNLSRSTLFDSLTCFNFTQRNILMLRDYGLKTNKLFMIIAC